MADFIQAHWSWFIAGATLAGLVLCLVLLAIATLTLVAGYAVLNAGHPSAAAVLLVVGYCILFPLAIAL